MRNKKLKLKTKEIEKEFNNPNGKFFDFLNINKTDKK